MMPYCGVAGDAVAAGVRAARPLVALRGLVHVEGVVADGGLHPGVVRRVLVRVGVWMWMGV